MKGLIGERVFQLYDIQGKNIINLKNFLSASYRFFQASFEEKMKLVFDIFDFDSDGIIAEEEIRAILSHIPLDLIVTLIFNI